MSARGGGLALAFVAAVAACSRAPSGAPASEARAKPHYDEEGCDDAAFDRARATSANGTEVTVCGHVSSVAGDVRTRGGLHKHWRLDVHDRRDFVEIDSNEDLEGPIDVARGAYAIVRGAYYADPGGRDGIHYTHRDPRGRHEAGWILIDGRLYQ